MQKSFNQPKKYPYILWNKREEEFDGGNTNAGLDDEFPHGVEIKTIMEDEKLFLTKRQKDYLGNASKTNITETPNDCEVYLFLEFEFDIYSIAFIKFMTSNDAILHRELMLKCALTFAF